MQSEAKQFMKDLKEKLSLLDVCKLPDVQLHSKTAFFKSIVGRQSAQALVMKEQIAGLSYTVKTIGVQGEEVGIMSKRLPLKFKKKEPQINHPNFLVSQNYLPHQSFFAHPLISVKKMKEDEPPTPTINLEINSRNTIQSQLTDKEYKTIGFKVRTKSMVQMRSYNSKVNSRINMDDFGKIKGLQHNTSTLKKKSFSGMLLECSSNRKMEDGEEINPIMHQQNPLFKKIIRIKDIHRERLSQEKVLVRYNPITKNRISSGSAILKQYKQQY